MDLAAPPRRIEGHAPTLRTLYAVERILRKAKAEGPISVEEIKRRMPAKRVRHQVVRHAIEHYKRFGLAVEGSKGVLWTYHPDAVFWSEPLEGLVPNERPECNQAE